MTHDTTDSTRPRARGRRAFLAGAGATALGALAGCSSGSAASGGSGTTTTPLLHTDAGTAGSGDRAPSIDDLPPLSGDLTVYLGRGEGGLYGDLVNYLQNTRYPKFSVSMKRGPSASLANTILTESENGTSPADVFWSIDASTLGLVATHGLAATLPTSLTDLVPAQFRDDERRWVGISGRARAIPYNTDAVDASDLPDSVYDLPGVAGVSDALGWAPSYGSFQAFVTAMRLLDGEERTRSWLRSMLDAGTQSYAGEFGVTYAVSQGTLTAGLANHYYALRLKQGRPDAPLDLAFTTDGPGSLVNVSGALVLDSSERTELATNFVRHFLTREVQQYLVENAYSYPLAPGVAPPSGHGIDLPSMDELSPPDLDLTNLSDLQATLDLLRETGAL